jgi:hypothetical protein
MFFRLLKLAGIDISAKLAELKADLAAWAEYKSDVAAHKARTLGLVAGLFLFAALLALLVLIVALVALYKWGELRHGVFVGLALDAGALIVLGAACVIAALTINKRSGTVPPPPRLARGPAGPAAVATPAPIAATEASAFGTRATARAEDLIEPLFVLLGRYARWPRTGHPAIDDLLQKVGSRSEAATNEAVTSAASLVRDGDRATMLSILAAAAFFGWLIVRAAPPSSQTLR